MKTLVILAASAALGLSGCATVTRGSNEAFQVITTPPGAQVQTSNGFSCAASPCVMQMPRRSEFVVTVSRAGCETVQSNVTNQVAENGGAALAGNILVGGVIGLGVDAATGASQELVPNPMNLTLECRGS